MKPENEEGRKIPFLFTPFPNFLIDSEYFMNANLVRFVLWALHRTTFNDTWEFSFGRQHCAKATGISEQKIRTIINQLTNQQLIQKVTSKSTNKYTIYKWLWESFPGYINQQNNFKSTTDQLQTNHYTDIRLDKKKQQQHNSGTNSQTFDASCFLPVAAAAFSGKAKQLFEALSETKREEVIALYQKRVKNQPIENPDAWIIKCIEENWLAEEKLSLPQPKLETSDFEKNRAFAQKLIQKFECHPGLHICLRSDFLELGNMKSHRWQIFFSEPSKTFLWQIACVLKKMGFDECCVKLQ